MPQTRSLLPQFKKTEIQTLRGQMSTHDAGEVGTAQMLMSAAYMLGNAGSYKDYRGATDVIRFLLEKDHVEKSGECYGESQR